jgi:aspartyl-tRNA(Asn)/glutamyl-tRNA(Gln) amidotransferase subunit C
MKITPEIVREVAALARLGLSDAEVETFAPQLDAILGYVEQLGALDTSRVEATSHVVPLDCPLRDDLERPSTPREQILARAPCADGEFFVVPRIIDVP